MSKNGRETGLQSFGNNWYVLGPMVTGPIDQGAIEIYDGQQRTTTLTLLFLAIRDAASYIERERNGCTPADRIQSTMSHVMWGN